MDDRLLGRRVLVVEDEMMIAMLLEDVLADLGCDVVGPAARLAEALQLIEATAVIDVAVLDVNLDGERSDAIADVLAVRGVPFVFATGYGRKGIADAYLNRPVLQKPYSQKTLAIALALVLQQRALAAA